MYTYVCMYVYKYIIYINVCVCTFIGHIYYEFSYHLLPLNTIASIDLSCGINDCVTCHVKYYPCTTTWTNSSST